MSSTGIALFVYDRPEHTERVLNGLQQNDVGHVYIFSDGAENSQDEQSVRRVREIVTNVDWCETTIISHEDNLGLAKSLITGISRVFEDHEQIIVLEDDCLPATNFVSFMKTSLKRYASNEQVMNVNGYSPPIDIPTRYSDDVYFTHRSSSWGWGTWESAWSEFNQNPFSIKELKENSDRIKQEVNKAGGDLYPMMRKQLKGQIDSWAVWWSYAIASNDGLCVNPINSKIKNIGFDGTGTHTGATDKYNVEIDSTPVNELHFPDEPFINENINLRYNKYISGGSRNVIKRYGAEFLKRVGLWDVYQSFTS
jgi:hypothetical protein